MEIKSNMAQVMLKANKGERLYEENKPKTYIISQLLFFFFQTLSFCYL